MLAAFVMLMGATRALAQNSIELKSSARLASGTALTLSQVAVLKGPDVEPLADVVIIPAEAAKNPTNDSATLTPEHIRQAIDQSRTVNWGRIMLRGSRCTVLPPLGTPAKRDSAKRQAPFVDQAVVAGTVRAVVMTRIEQVAQADASDLRVTFDDRDVDILAMPVGGRTIDVRANGISDKLPLSISVFEGDRSIANRSIRVGVLVHRNVLKSLSVRRKGDLITESDLEHAEEWLPLTAKPASAEQVLNAAVQTRLTAGGIIMEDDVAAPLAVQKGEIVAVRVLSGSVSLATKARAMGPARKGELVRLQALDSKREFVGRMDGRGRAVIVAGETPTELADARPILSPRSAARTEALR
jgi:flagella basal body P-ring formation protein FlgA